MNNANPIVILCDRAPAAAPLLLAGHAAQGFPDYQDFRASGLRPIAFVLRSGDGRRTAALLQQLRRDPDHGAALVFVDGALDEADAALADGTMPANPQLLLERVAQATGRLQAIRARNDDRSPAALLLEYLWLRPGQIFAPRADWRHPQRWHYPLLEAFDPESADPQVWLQQLDRDGLLERVELKARQRECDFCGSAQLNFIDVCPSCRSIDIDQHAALHCFTCGLIAPEERYVRGGQRICPKCGTQLRHIGSDYDRPLETSACASCDHIFVEGDVVAQCMVCSRSMAPTALRLHKIHSWRLSSLGCLAAQGRHGLQPQRAFDERHYATRGHFLHSLDWMLKIARERADGGIGLLGLRLQNGPALSSGLGDSRAAQLVDGFADHLRELLGEADLASRIDADTIALLLPNCDRARLAQLHKAIEELAARSRQPGGLSAEWQLSELRVEGRRLQEADAGALLRQLAGESPVQCPQAEAA